MSFCHVVASKPPPLLLCRSAFMVSAIAQHIAAMDGSSPPRIDGVPYALISNDNSFTGW